MIIHIGIHVKDVYICTENIDLHIFRTPLLQLLIRLEIQNLHYDNKQITTHRDQNVWECSSYKNICASLEIQSKES